MAMPSPILARVVSASPSRESVDCAVVALAFENTGDGAARAARYEIAWTAGGGGRHQGNGPPEPIAPGAARTWTVKVNDGDFAALLADPASARVRVL